MAKVSKTNTTYCKEKFCQSCGIPMKKSALHPNLDYGTEKYIVKDGDKAERQRESNDNQVEEVDAGTVNALIVDGDSESCKSSSSRKSHKNDGENFLLSNKYCNLCYGDGEFYWKGENVSDFQAMVIDKMTKEGHFWWITAWILTRPIPYMERWKNREDT